LLAYYKMSSYICINKQGNHTLKTHDMKKGTQIQVSSKARYNGQDMEWTETFTGKKIIGEGGETVFHKSDKMISVFAEKEICVSPFEHGKSYLVSTASKKEITSKYNWKQFIYAIFLPEGFEVDTYSGDEYRFELTEGMKVVFAGTVYEAKSGQKMNTYGNLVDTYVKFSDTVKL
jgi:hypothetical protein